ncbi:hypothetical protein PRK78_001178 [Emydomyces testavorans]|uniref:Uncharacterized protein n=1 Tax=Emydomyces testavorans TaxID=2070801 RepID=A0AAF0DCZ6_9EURO|nr:hypothetical protein PRK78_001178 [Emydomyces testavorans]
MSTTIWQTVLDMPPILRLPEELLYLLLDWLVEIDPPYRCGGRARLYSDWAMTLTCKRFHFAAMPYLYRTIRFGGRHEARSFLPMGHSVRCLHRTLSASADLRPLCRHLVIREGAPGPLPQTDFVQATELLKFLTGVQKVEIDGRVLCRVYWPTFSLSKWHTPIQELKIRAPHTTEELSDIFHHLSPSVRKLSFSGFWLLCDDHRPTPLMNTASGLYSRAEPSRISTVTSLTITDFSYNGKINVLKRFLATFTALKHFSLAFRTNGKTNSDLTLPMLVDFLRTHRHSLKTINLRSYNVAHDPWKACDFDFPEMEFLRIPGHLLTGTYENVKVMADRIAASQIRCLVLEYFYADTFAETTADFGVAEIQWLYEFVQQESIRGSSLMEIKIAFDQKIYLRSSPYSCRHHYPWKMLLELQNAVVRFGIKLTCDKLLELPPWYGEKHERTEEMWSYPTRITSLADARLGWKCCEYASMAVLPTEISTYV